MSGDCFGRVTLTRKDGLAMTAYERCVVPTLSASDSEGDAMWKGCKPRVMHRLRQDNANRPYWTLAKPQRLEDVIGGTAVRPEWNNFQYLYEYEVPPDVVIRCWTGTTAREQVDKVHANFHLPGGLVQLYIPDIVRQDSNFAKSLTETEAQW